MTTAIKGTKKATKNSKPKMTKEQAVSFDRYSVTNATIAETTFDCGCQAYERIFTYARWTALGFQVRRGEHGVKISTIKNVEKKNENGEIEMHQLFHTSTVFCSHQVDPK